MDALVASGTLTFEDWRFDLRERTLFRRARDGAWTMVPVGSRALAILAVLLEHAGEIVSRGDIMDAVWPRVAVEPNNLTVQLTALRRVLDDGRIGGSCIQTVPGRGYRFIPHVRRIADDTSEPPLPEVAAPPPDNATTQPSRRRIWRRLAVGATGLAVAVLVIIVASGVRRAEPAMPPRLSIVVLPFENLSDNRSEDYLADAITDDVTTELARLPAMFVVARESAFTYQGKAIDVRRIGEELGVRYALEGSVRKLGDVLRVNAQLISTETGAHLWAYRFDQQLKNLGTGQEAIVLRIGQTLNVALTDIESARSKRERAANPDAFDLILRARSLGQHTMGPREHAERKALYEEALRLDPSALLAMTGLANELIRLTLQGYNPAGDELERAASLIAKAEAIDPNHQFVLANKAFLQFAQGRFTDSIATFKRLLDEYPNDDSAYNQIGDCLIRTGHAEEAIPMIEKAIRIDPRSPYSWSRYENMGFALLLLGRDEESIVWTQRALTAKPR
jgi:TolB-like protein/DNA-binding winged helix-turn-helix (wHTH) protein